jgi:Raf kinase inhibitor-like YbhB/YbcL family protein
MLLSIGTSAFTPVERSAGTSASVGSDASRIPARFAMRAVSGGQNISIPYSWGDAPAGTKSFALVVVDTAPVANRWVHWMVVELPPDARSLLEGASGTSAMLRAARELTNSFGFAGYGGPQPPPGSGRHDYVATLYALDVPALGLPSRTSLDDFERELDSHVLASGTCTGSFSR